ncbi:MAG: DUF115 domain-containing protein [Candidatus Omnitrophica bacterium]|nr:DUF115 domain-containing protein [Candidatus Omnitrophota bacterium]
MEKRVYQQNMAIIRDRYPALYETLEKTPENPGVELLQARNGLLTLRVNGKFFHSAYDPWRASEYLTEDIKTGQAEGVIVLGFGLGYHVKKIWENRDFDGSILIIERDPSVFKKVLQHIDLRNMLRDSRVIFIVEEEPEAAVKKIERRGFFKLNMVHIELLIHPPSVQTFLEYYVPIAKAVRGLVSFTKGSWGALNIFQDIWPQNILSNLQDLVRFPGTKEVEGIVAGDRVPAIVVSAGPSLDQDIEELKKLKGKVPIFCVGTAHKALHTHGLVPDFVVALDAKERVAEQLEGVETQGVTLFAVDFVNHQVVEQFKPEVFFFHSTQNPFMILLPEHQRFKGHVYAGGSVCHAAVDIAAKMGFSPVVLVGQDLAFLENRTHAGGTIYDRKRVSFKDEDEFKKKNLIWLKGNYREKVVSTQVFYVFLNMMERYIKNHPDTEFWNATSAGAFIEGARLVKMKDVRQTYQDCEFLPMIRHRLDKVKREFTPALDSFRDQLEQSREQMRKITEDLEIGYEKACRLKAFLDGNDEVSRHREEIQDIVLTLDHLGTQLDSNPYTSMLQYGRGFCQFLALDVELRHMRLKAEVPRKICAEAGGIYKGFLDTSTNILETIEDILVREAIWKQDVTKVKSTG